MYHSCSAQFNFSRKIELSVQVMLNKKNRLPTFSAFEYALKPLFLPIIVVI